MESSPLKYLDNDVSQMLCEQVRLSREEEARRFHDNLFHYGEKLNGELHNFIVRIYSRMTYTLYAMRGGASHWRPADSPEPYCLRLRLNSQARRLRRMAGSGRIL